MTTFAYKTAQQLPRLMTGGVVGGSGKRLLGREGSALSIGAPGGPMYRGQVRTDIKASATFAALVGGFLWAKDILETKTGLTPEQINKVKELDPQYISEGLTLMVPFKAKNGTIRHADLTYATPWPALVNMANAAGYGTVKEFLGQMIPAPTNPIITSLYTAQTGYDTFSKKRLWSEAVQTEADRGNQAAKAEIQAKLKEWWTKTAMPNLYPGGTGFNRVKAAVKGEEFQGRTQSVPEALAGSLGGVPIREVDLGKAAMKRQSELNRVIEESLFKSETMRNDLESGKLKPTGQVMKQRLRLGQIAEEAQQKLVELGLDEGKSLDMKRIRVKIGAGRGAMKRQLRQENYGFLGESAAGGQ